MPTQSFSHVVVRPEDLLFLSFEFHDVDFTPPSAAQPGQIVGLGASHLVVHFPPQHVAEEAFYQATPTLQQSPDEIAAGQPPPPGNEPPAYPGSVRARLAGPSRLVFDIPSGESFPYTLEGLLEALTRLPQRVSPVSRYEPPQPGCSPVGWLSPIWQGPSRAPVVAPPTATQTAIEAPYRLFLSPDQLATWRHARLPIWHDNWTELWHTRLGSRRSNGDPRVRAIWSPDFRPESLQTHYNSAPGSINDDPFRASLDARDRNEIVHLSANYHLDEFVPTPVATERFMLTALGAWLRVHGKWEPPLLGEGLGSLTVEEWRHDATMGRDQEVRVLYAGYLFPFGHRATLVKVTERRFFYRQDSQTPGYVAYLFQRMFILVREPTRHYSHRAMPFRTVTLQTHETPNLADPSASQIAGQGQSAFWPRVVVGAGIEDFPFVLAATDWEGRVTEFTAPLIFVDKNVDETAISAILTHYAGYAVTDPRRRRPLNGQLVAFAPPSKPGDTALEAAAIVFGAENRPGERPHFRPLMARSEVDLPAAKQLAGISAPSAIEWEPTYLVGSGSSIGNAGQVFAKLVSVTPLAFGSTEKTGGLVAPNLSISGLSRSLGPVGGPVNQMVGGNFKPLDIFGDDVKLLGGIKLAQIIKDMIFYNAANTAQKVPQLVTVREGDVIRTTYRWELAQSELVNTGLFIPRAGATFVLSAIVEKKLDNSPPTFTVTGTLTHFSVKLLPAAALAEIDFHSMTFTKVPDKKVDIAVQLGEIRFLGILAFVNELSSFLPLDGFDDPPNLDIVATPHPGLALGFTLGIPTIGIGIMTMQNVSLSAGFFLPFGTAPLNFHFAFCERHQPFILTVSLFGGGGFFSMDVGVHSVVLIEAALEFGASIALNLGVASGQASIMAGFYFQKAGADFQLTGYFRAAGSLSVLGIITVSLEFYLGLSYASKGISPHGGTLWGQARLTVKIEILFFSISVGVSMEREFAGSDPTFRQLIAPTAWEEYCDAFADYP